MWQVMCIPSITALKHFIGFKSSARRQWQLIELHFPTWRGQRSLWEQEEASCLSTPCGLMEIRWNELLTLPHNLQFSDLFLITKKTHFNTSPTELVWHARDTKRQLREITSVTADYCGNFYDLIFPTFIPDSIINQVEKSVFYFVLL